MTAAVTTVLFWDIDGTLLTTGRAGVLAWEGAAAEVGGRPVDFRNLQTAGLTDYQIGVRILDHLALEATDERLGDLVRRYEELLPGNLPKRQGRVLDNVREILEHVETERPDVVSYLLTGNTRDGAKAKLTHYDLQKHFSDGAFAADPSDRANVARAALAMAARLHGSTADDVVVIGDTPHDIRCGQAIGARTLAVASGEYSLSELRSHGPWQAIERLPDPEAFLDLVRQPAARSSSREC
jgi:phosphoglycolate phosphatase-like HAD superfamily hydrolase